MYIPPTWRHQTPTNLFNFKNFHSTLATLSTPHHPTHPFPTNIIMLPPPTTASTQKKTHSTPYRRGWFEYKQDSSSWQNILLPHLIYVPYPHQYLVYCFAHSSLPRAERRFSAQKLFFFMDLKLHRRLQRTAPPYTSHRHLWVFTQLQNRFMDFEWSCNFVIYLP